MSFWLAVDPSLSTDGLVGVTAREPITGDDAFSGDGVPAAMATPDVFWDDAVPETTSDDGIFPSKDDETPLIG